MKKFMFYASSAMLAISLLAAFTPQALADATAATNAGAGASINGIGTVSWTNPGRITADDSLYATATLAGGGTVTSKYLQGTNYGFNIPSNATINGIGVSVNRFGSSVSGGKGVRDVVVSLVKGGTITGSNEAATGTVWPISSASVANYGSAADLWGASWAPADINASNFGVALAALDNSTGSRTASVNYVSMTVYYTIRVNQATLTVTGLPASATYGQSGIVAGTSGGSGAGVVTFNAGTSTACSVNASTGAVTITGSSGTCSITATKAADSSYNSITSNPFSITVSPAVTTLSVAPISGAVSAAGGYNLSFTAIATMTPAVSGKLITFSLNGTVVAEAYTGSNGVATMTGYTNSVSAGDYPTGVLASFAGDGNYAASSNTADLSVTFQAATNLLVVPASGTYGDTLNLTATLTLASDGSGIPGETIVFYIGNPGKLVGSAVTNANGVATLPALLKPNVGVYISGFLANFSGDANYALSGMFNGLTVNQRPLTITADGQSKVYGTADPALTYTITSGSLITGDSLTGVLARDSGENVGTYAINQNTLSAGPNYIITFVPANLTITPASQTITFTSTAPNSATAGEATYTPTATGGASGNQVIFTIDLADSSACSISAGVVSFTAAGTCVIDADQAGNANYNSASQAQQSFTVTAATSPTPVTIDMTPIAGIAVPVAGATPTATIGDTKEYTAIISWLANDATFAASTMYTATITITPKTGYTLTGVAQNFFTIAGATATNAANSGVVTAVFPATGGGSGSSIAISSINIIGDTNVANGTALGSVGLPANVGATLSDTSTSTLAVTWDGGTPSYSTTVAGTYTFTGSLTLPSGVTNPNNLTAKVNVIVAPPIPVPVTLTSIAITIPATKTSYVVGDTLDITGLVVTGTYSDNNTTTEPITAANVTGFDSSVPVTGQVLTITFGGKTTTYTVDIVAASNPNPALTVSSINAIGDINVAGGTALNAAGLPTTATVTLSDSSTYTLAITWDGGTPIYSGAIAGTYIFTGTLTLSGGITNPGNLTAKVNVVVAAATSGGGGGRGGNSSGGGTAYYSINVTKNGNGSGNVMANGINCNVSCKFPSGTTSVSLTATPAKGSGFGVWTDDCAASGTSTTCSLILKGNKIVGVSFIQGQVLGASTTLAHPDGTLVLDGQTIYLIQNQKRYGFQSQAEYLSYGYKFSQTVAISAADKLLPEGSILKAMEGTLVLDKSDNLTVYIIGANSTKRGFASAQVFTALGYSFANLFKINLSGYPVGDPIVSANSPHPEGAIVTDGKQISWITGNARHLFTAATLTSYGFNKSRAVKANNADLALPLTDPVKFRDGTLVKDGGTYYIISDGLKLPFASVSVLSAWGYSLSNIITANLSSYQQAPSTIL